LNNEYTEAITKKKNIIKEEDYDDFSFILKNEKK
jgi:hypothetical protein